MLWLQLYIIRRNLLKCEHSDLTNLPPLPLFAFVRFFRGPPPPSTNVKIEWPQMGYNINKKVSIFQPSDPRCPTSTLWLTPPQCGSWSVDSGGQQSNQPPPRASTCFVLKLFYLVANYYYYNQTKNIIIIASECPFYIFEKLVKLYIYLLHLGFMRLVEFILFQTLHCTRLLQVRII